MTSHLVYNPYILFFIALIGFRFADTVETLFHQAGIQTLDNEYAHRRTENKKEGIDVPRIFVQAKFQANLKRLHDCSVLNSLRDICAVLSTAMVERMLLLVHFIHYWIAKKDKKEFNYLLRKPHKP